jgi:glycine cleavage system regulatory protein
MNTDLVLTLLGPDRPGLVEAVAQAIVASGGNWVESRMARLAGKFAGLLRVELPSAAVEQLRAALARLETHGLKIVLEPSETVEPIHPQQVMELELLGLDRPGLVREVSRLLAAQQINVEELVTDRSSAPMSAEMMFRARARLAVPAGVDVAAVRASLERLASDLMVEIRLAEPGR